MRNSAIEWLLEENDPPVRYRAMRELLSMPRAHPNCVAAREALLAYLPQARDPAWQSGCKGLWLIYHLTALAECGLDREDIGIETAVSRSLEPPFDGGCGDALLLRALVMLGCGADVRVRERLDAFGGALLPDGGFLCMHRIKSRKDTPKSCYKANLHALLLHGECKKRGIDARVFEPLPDYFLRRNIFYRTGSPDTLVLEAREGWRAVDTFHPMEAMRVGIHCIVHALYILGYGQTAQCERAWSMLEHYRDEEGRYTLAGTLNKSYLPKERVGKPSKWVTLYALLSQGLTAGGPMWASAPTSP